MDINRRNFLKKLTAATGVAAIAPVLARAAETAETTGTAASVQMPYFAPGHKLLISHRGASAYAPENTLPAYELAIKQGAELVEQDLQITRDGILVCNHDGYLERVTNVEEVFPDRFKLVKIKGKDTKRWPLNDFTLKELKTLDFGSFLDPKFKGTQIPTWQEAIDLIKGKAGLCPETKSPETYSKLGFDMDKLVVDVLKKNGLAKADPKSKTPVFMQSFSDKSLLNLQRKHGIDWPMLWLRGAKTKLTPALLAETKKNFAAIGPYKKDIDLASVKAAHAMGLKVVGYTWNVEDLEPGFPDVAHEMSHYLYDIGIDGLFTNNPDKFPRKKL
jgi:glycerophosphoryl diester phosphodiesterase